jgi:transposase-like protein
VFGVKQLTEITAMAMLVSACCPACGSTPYKKNGPLHKGTQNYQCKGGGREFVLTPEPVIISAEKRQLIKRLLLERVSLRGMCRGVSVSLKWLLEFSTET